MTLESFDKQAEFTVFMRINEQFPENFSVGLNYHPKDEPRTIPLLRCNGPHGEHVNNPLDPQPHFGCHIHRATADALNTSLSPEVVAELTRRYASYEEALSFFMNHVNITNAGEYFDLHPELPLFPNPGDLA